MIRRRPTTRAIELMRRLSAWIVLGGVVAGSLDLHSVERRDAHGAAFEPAGESTVAPAAEHPADATHLEGSPLVERDRCAACLLALGSRGDVDATGAPAPAESSRCLPAADLPRLASLAALPLGARGPPAPTSLV
jgi:hypothetical protein